MDKERNIVNRSFAENILKLRKETINFNRLGILTKLKLTLTETNNVIVVYFDIDSDLWVLIHNDVETKNWNIPISQLIKLLDNFSKESILKGMQNFNDILCLELSKINALKLSSNVLKTMHLMQFEENNIKPLPTLNFSNEFKIWYDFDNSCYKLWSADKGIEIADEVFSEFGINQVLRKTNFYSVTVALREVYHSLKRRI